METLENWLYQPQECEGTYGFSGRFFITAGIEQKLSREEIFDIYMFIRTLADENKNLDYLQVFIHKVTRQKLFFIDQLNKEMIESGSFSSEDNYCTLLLSSEY
jgi:hypothetical protein